jgi:hypothetical protein
MRRTPTSRSGSFCFRVELATPSASGAIAKAEAAK